MTKRSSLHPFTRALYERTDDGNVRVTDGPRQGLFGPDGRWISGALREADPQLCVWVSADATASSVGYNRATHTPGRSHRS